MKMNQIANIFFWLSVIFFTSAFILEPTFTFVMKLCFCGLLCFLFFIFYGIYYILYEHNS